MVKRKKKSTAPKIGKEELVVFQFIQQHAPATVRKVADHFADQGKARTTILTVMERLRDKGLLEREKQGGAFGYSPTPESATMTQSLIRAFIAEVLGGSVVPFMAYMSEASELSEEELQELRAIVDAMEEKQTNRQSRSKSK